MSALGFGIGVATATAAGAVYGMRLSVQPRQPLRPDLARCSRSSSSAASAAWAARSSPRSSWGSPSRWSPLRSRRRGRRSSFFVVLIAGPARPARRGSSGAAERVRCERARRRPEWSGRPASSARWPHSRSSSPQPWVVNIAFFTLMYAALATAWNLLGGYSGYLSLGHVAFFGIGAYAMGILLQARRRSATRLHAVLRAPGRRRRPSRLVARSRSPGWRCATRRGDVRHRHADAAVRRPAARLQPALAHQRRRRAWRCPRRASRSRPTSGRSTSRCSAVLALAVLTAAWHALREQARADAVRRSATTRRRRAASACARPGRSWSAFAVSVGLTAMAGGVWAYYHRLHLPAVRRRPAGHDRRRPDGVPRRPRHAVGADAGRASSSCPAQQYLAYELGASELYLVGYAAVFLVVMLVLPRGILPVARATRRRAARPRRRVGASRGRACRRWRA